MTFYNYIKSHRKRHGLNQHELAYLLGTSHASTVSRIEKDQQKPSLEDMIALEMIFQMNMSQLFPDLYQFVSNKVLYRIDLFQQNLDEGDMTLENIEKMNTLKTIRSKIAKANKAKV